MGHIQIKDSKLMQHTFIFDQNCMHVCMCMYMLWVSFGHHVNILTKNIYYSKKNIPVTTTCLSISPTCVSLFPIATNSQEVSGSLEGRGQRSVHTASHTTARQCDSWP